MWAITVRELKDRKWSLLAYSLGSLMLLWIYVATFRSTQMSAAQLQQLLKGYPKALVETLGLSSMSINSIEGYLNAKHFSLMWPLMAIILVLSRAGNQIAGEIHSGTMGLLLAMPLERWRIFAAKYLAGLITIAIFTAVSVFGVVPLAALYNIPVDLKILSTTWLLIGLFMWAVYATSLAVSSWASEKGKVYGIVGTLLIAMYSLNIVALLVDKVEFLKYGTFFYYFDTAQALGHGHIGLHSILFFAGVILVTTAVAARRYISRDISV